MSSDPLLPVYLLTGSDRPKHLRALRRLRARFDPEAVEQLTADASGRTPSRPATRSASSARRRRPARDRRGVDRWRKADVDAVAEYLRNPVEGAVLALVVDGPLRGSTLDDLCAKHGQVLNYDVPKSSNFHKWVQAELKRLGVSADADAARALVELVGDDTVALAGRDREARRVGRRGAGRPPRGRAARDAGPRSRGVGAHRRLGQRDLPALLEACELALERKEPFLLAVGSRLPRRASPSGSGAGRGRARRPRDRRPPEDEGVSRAEGATARRALLARESSTLRSSGSPSSTQRSRATLGSRLSSSSCAR